MPFVWILLASLVLHLAAGWLTLGFSHPDEHFQTIEFAAARLGMTSTATLPWEYADRMRAWIQPALYAAVMKLSMAAGVQVHAEMTRVLRIFSALLGWASTLALALYLPRWLKSERLRLGAVLCVALFWMTPFFHARTSSENFSSSMLAFGLMALESAVAPGKAVLGAFLLGMAFQFRFQMAFAIGPALAWFWIFRQDLRKYVGHVATGFALSFALAALVDRWGYGVWAFPPWNYFVQNILHSRAESFGTLPWWGFFALMWERLTPPLTILIVGITVSFWVLRWRHLLAWCTAPFVLAHFAFAHKELRFLYPVLVFFPLFPFLAYEGLPESTRARISGLWGRFAPVRWVAYLAIALNLVFVVFNSLLPISHGQRLIEYISRYHADRLSIVSNLDDPFGGDIKMTFYQPKSYQFTRADYLPDFIREADAHVPGRHFYFDGKELPTLGSELEARGCVLEYKTLPDWARRFNINNWLSRTRFWQLYKC